MAVLLLFPLCFPSHLSLQCVHYLTLGSRLPRSQPGFQPEFLQQPTRRRRCFMESSWREAKSPGVGILALTALAMTSTALLVDICPSGSNDCQLMRFGWRQQSSFAYFVRCAWQWNGDFPVVFLRFGFEVFLYFFRWCLDAILRCSSLLLHLSFSISMDMMILIVGNSRRLGMNGLLSFYPPSLLLNTLSLNHSFPLNTLDQLYICPFQFNQPKSVITPYYVVNLGVMRG